MGFPHAAHVGSHAAREKPGASATPVCLPENDSATEWAEWEGISEADEQLWGERGLTRGREDAMCQERRNPFPSWRHQSSTVARGNISLETGGVVVQKPSVVS